jgi:tRNA U54 and U55 pseudouridine synthase Pus10
MGLLERVRTYGRKRYTYLIPSLPIRMFYYLDSRYDITEREVSFSEIAPTAEGLLRSGIEEFIVDLLTEHVGGRKERLKDSEREVDVLVTVRNKPALVGEVKWGRATRGDVTTFLEKVEDLRCRKVLFSLKPLDTDEVEVLLPSTLVDEVTGTRAH